MEVDSLSRFLSIAYITLTRKVRGEREKSGGVMQEQEGGNTRKDGFPEGNLNARKVFEIRVNLIENRTMRPYTLIDLYPVPVI